MTATTRTLAIFCVLAVLTAGSAHAQPPANAQIIAALKPITTPLKTTFRTPLYVNTPPGVKLKAVTVNVNYPKGILIFGKAERGILLQSGAYTLEATAGPHAKDSKFETVTVVVKTDSADANAALPNGLMAYLEFSIGEKAVPSAVTMEPDVVSAEPAAGSPQLSKSRWFAEGETVTIVGDDMVPILACFFYMH
jgi:hypothetical protein